MDSPVGFELTYVYDKEEQTGSYWSEYQEFFVISRKVIKEGKVRRHEKHLLAFSPKVQAFLGSFVSLRKASTGANAVFLTAELAIKHYLCKQWMENTIIKQKILADAGLAPKVLSTFSSELPWENFLIMENVGSVVSEDKDDELSEEAQELYSKAKELGLEPDDIAPDNVLQDDEGRYWLIDFDGWSFQDPEKEPRLTCDCHRDH